MSKPWMKFYPADWQADPALRSCSLSARGLWVEMLAVMQKSERVGYLLVNGKPPAPRTLAVLCGASAREVSKGLGELEAAGVFSRDGDSVIFSRRMVRDEEKAERDKANGGRGGNPKLKGQDKGGVNPTDKGGDKAQKPEARDSSVSNETGAAAPIDPDKKAWQDGVALLMSKGVDERPARQFIGKLVKDIGGEARALLPIIARCIEIGSEDPQAYLRKAVRAHAERRSGGSAPPLPLEPDEKIDWAWRLEQFRGPDRVWVESMWGPRPGQPGCQCPPELLEGA